MNQPFEILATYGVRLGYDVAASMLAARQTIETHAHAKWPEARDTFLAHLANQGA